MSYERKLRDLLGIAQRIERQLMDIDINSPARLSDVGSHEAFRRLRNIDPSLSVNILYALEGAISEVHWHDFTREEKALIRAKLKP